MAYRKLLGSLGMSSMVLATIGPMLLAGTPASAQHEVAVVTVKAGAVARQWELVCVEVPRQLGTELSVVDLGSGQEIPAQTEPGAEPDRVRATWVVVGLAAGESRRYRVEARPKPGTSAPAVVIDRSEETAGKLHVLVKGRPFTTYRTGTDFGRPFCFPVLGPQGERVTRAFPIEKDVPGESTDHPHHLSFWFAFGAVNGVDCWAAGGRTVHRRFEALESGSVFGRIRSVNDWVDAQGKKLMEDTRELRVYDAGDKWRIVDFEITLRATEGDVTLGDTKEGMFAIRPASSMEVARGQGGRIENSRGGVNEKETWGKRAEWCDYSGPVGDHRVGIAILDHPGNFRHPTYWMVRDYGLFACNPFGVRAYTGDPNQDGTHVLPKGAQMTFRYRVIIHEGDAAQARIADWWASYTSPAQVSVASPEAFDWNIPEGFSLLFQDDFENGAQAWQPREGNRWQVAQLEGGGHGYCLTEKGQQGAIRAPGGFSLIRDRKVGDFVLTAKARCLTPNAVRGRDVIVVFGYQDPTHFYYVHFSNYTDPIHNAICIVNGEPRAPITAQPPNEARLTTEGFHRLKVVRVGKRIEAYIDDMSTPLMYAEDDRLGEGLVGVGSFDDTAIFDDVKLYAREFQ